MDVLVSPVLLSGNRAGAVGVSRAVDFVVLVRDVDQIVVENRNGSPGPLFGQSVVHGFGAGCRGAAHRDDVYRSSLTLSGHGVGESDQTVVFRTLRGDG